MKNKGFTLIELLAVIVILGIIMVIATTSVSKSLEESRKRAKFIAAKEITEIASAYMETENIDDCVLISDLVAEGYLENDATNPRTGKNIFDFEGDDNSQRVCAESSVLQNNYEVIDNKYEFDNYVYYLN